MLRWFERSQIFHPTKEWISQPQDLGRPFEDVWFTSSDGVRLNAWFFPADVASPRRQFAFLVCHGNGGNISHRLPLCRSLLGTGVNVMVVDYRGYGRSEGELSEEGTYLDARAAYEWLLGRGFEPHCIIGYGESLGGGVACELALREPLGALILHSTFTSIADIGAELFPWLPVRWLHSIKYDTRSKLPRITIPVLILHSVDDELIHFHHAEKNFSAANQPKFFWETHGGHNYSESRDYDHSIKGIEQFLRFVEGRDNAARKKEDLKQPG